MNCIKHIFFILLIFSLSASYLTGCRSSQSIPSDSSNSAIITSRKEVLQRIASEVAKGIPFDSYFAKNSSMDVTFGSSDYSLRLNLFFENSKETVLSAKLSFPPMLVGSASLSSSSVKAKSKVLGVDFDRNVSINFNKSLQFALAGSIPPVYELFGLSSFDSFGISISSDDKYRLSKSVGSISVIVDVATSDFTLSGFTIKAPQGSVNAAVLSRETFDGYVLPNKLKLDVSFDVSKSVSAIVDVTKVSINGSERISF